jgi:exonuclease VII large subunit
VIGAARRLRDAERDAHHAAAIVAARDMRSSGWLLAETDDGAPLRRAAEVAEGDRLRLHFADGRVDAIAEGTEAEVASAAGHGLFSPTEPTTPEAGA